MRFWLALTAALIIPSLANAGEFGKLNRLQGEIEKLNERIEMLEQEITRARNTEQTSAYARAQRSAPVSVVVLPAPIGKIATVLPAIDHPQVVAAAPVESEMPALRRDEELVLADAETVSPADEEADLLEEDEALIRLDPETGAPIRTAPAPKEQPSVSPEPCVNKSDCKATALRDQQALVLPPKDVPLPEPTRPSRSRRR